MRLSVCVFMFACFLCTLTSSSSWARAAENVLHNSSSILLLPFVHIKELRPGVCLHLNGAVKTRDWLEGGRQLCWCCRFYGGGGRDKKCRLFSGFFPYGFFGLDDDDALLQELWNLFSHLWWRMVRLFFWAVINVCALSRVIFTYFNGAAASWQ